jgi:hypothetical protein
MSRAATPRQIDIVRAVRSAAAAGLRVVKIEVEGPKITVVTEPLPALPDAAQAAQTQASTGWEDFH